MHTVTVIFNMVMGQMSQRKKKVPSVYVIKVCNLFTLGMYSLSRDTVQQNTWFLLLFLTI